MNKILDNFFFFFLKCVFIYTNNLNSDSSTCMLGNQILSSSSPITNLTFHLFDTQSIFFKHIDTHKYDERSLNFIEKSFVLLILLFGKNSSLLKLSECAHQL